MPRTMTAELTILICTHNRAELLARTLDFLNQAKRPAQKVEVLVVANACTDGTHDLLDRYTAQFNGSLPLRWLVQPIPGKSHALNLALKHLDAPLVAMVDDDHRVDADYLTNIIEGTAAHPEANIYCGRIIPDWDGSEPPWIHDDGPYRIYPLPVPRYDLGNGTRTLDPLQDPLPGGGNLVLRRRILESNGLFSTNLGPRGHNLGGGEDLDYVRRAVGKGEQIRYLPGVIQYHYADGRRLRLFYLMRKAYQRTLSHGQVYQQRGLHLYMWRKLAGYIGQSLASLSWPRRRFYLVRSAAALGEISAGINSLLDHRRRGRGSRISIGDRATRHSQGLGFLTAVFGLLAFLNLPMAQIAAPVLGAAALASALLAARSALHFSRTGPRLRQEILTRYRYYTLYAFMRLSLFAFVVALLTGAAGAAVYAQMSLALDKSWSGLWAFAAALAAIVLATGWRLAVKLLDNPGLVVASTHYRPSRFYALWRMLSPERLQTLRTAALAAALLLAGLATRRLALDNDPGGLVALWSGGLFYLCLLRWAEGRSATPQAATSPPPAQTPNIILLGSDTLRADILGRGLTPHLDELARQGTWFSQCYVPCARTAPSLASLLTGLWPTSHGIRDNFVSDDDANHPLDALPRWLAAKGYRSAAISDWCGADLGKLDFGFELLDVPEDQWNLKYLIRQGPKDLRLFLSLFLHNQAGRLLLPEIYYQGGVPLTEQLGPRARRLAARLGESGKPFLLNVFYSTTNPPFASEWPWYTRYADAAYEGESKFAMARLTDPMDVLRRQGEPREEFDLEQILHLYEGCAAQFDHEVGLFLEQLERSGLAQNTVLVIYSDHGMEFFEHDTWGQGNSAVGEASPRVPLILRDPRRPGRGRVDQVVRSIDLAPTLAELAGASPPDKTDGVSLVPLLSNPGQNLDLPAYNETGLWLTAMPGQAPEHLRYPDLLELIDVPDLASGTLALKEGYLPAILAAKDRMLRVGAWKLVYQPLRSGPLLLLFDLERDPACTRDVAAQHPEIVEHLWQRLQQDWLQSDRLPACGAGAAEPEAENTPQYDSP